MEALAAAGPAAPSLLRDALRDPDPGVRWHAAAAFMQLGGRAGDVAPALLAAMDDPVWTVRNAAGPRAGRSRDRGRRARAGHARWATPARRPATTSHAPWPAWARGRRRRVPALVAGLRDADWEVRLESARALGAVGARARGGALPALEAY